MIPTPTVMLSQSRHCETRGVQVPPPRFGGFSDVQSSVKNLQGYRGVALLGAAFACVGRRFLTDSRGRAAIYGRVAASRDFRRASARPSCMMVMANRLMPGMLKIGAIQPTEGGDL
jgi:hypothetical protein